MRVAILGATGRMGVALIRLIADSADCQLSGAATRPDERDVGADAGAIAGVRHLAVAIGTSPATAVAGCDVAIDFTAAVATDAHLAACIERGCALVLGTTGLEARQISALEAAARSIPIVYGRNMSIGVAVFTELARIAARSFGADADVEIIETHHRNKVDAPSGTALQIGEVVAAELGGRLEDLAVFDRFASRGARRPGSIGFSSIRAGAVVGDHDVQFALAEEIVTLRHRALDRASFARGALLAARWVAGRSPGLYSMGDVLGLASRTG